MECWVCAKSASAVCKFCGRAVCKEHTAKMPYLMSVYIGKNEVPKVIAVADAIWCGQCRPRPEPIEMPELY